MPIVYMPMVQYENRMGSMTFDLRTSVPRATIAPIIREIVHRIDPDTPVFDLASENALVARSTEQERAIAQLASMFGLLAAAALASIGLFALVSFLVAGRRIETGIRIALGAERGRIIRGVPAEAMAVVLLGIAIGIPATFLAGKPFTTFFMRSRPTTSRARQAPRSRRRRHRFRDPRLAGRQRRPGHRAAKRVKRESATSPGGRNWSAGWRPPECDLRVNLETYADISFACGLPRSRLGRTCVKTRETDAR